MDVVEFDTPLQGRWVNGTTMESLDRSQRSPADTSRNKDLHTWVGTDVAEFDKAVQELKVALQTANPTPAWNTPGGTSQLTSEAQWTYANVWLPFLTQQLPILQNYVDGLDAALRGVDSGGKVVFVPTLWEWARLQIARDIARAWATAALEQSAQWKLEYDLQEQRKAKLKRLAQELERRAKEAEHPNPPSGPSRVNPPNLLPSPSPNVAPKHTQSPGPQFGQSLGKTDRSTRKGSNQGGSNPDQNRSTNGGSADRGSAEADARAGMERGGGSSKGNADPNGAKQAGPGPSPAPKAPKAEVDGGMTAGDATAKRTDPTREVGGDGPRAGDVPAPSPMGGDEGGGGEAGGTGYQSQAQVGDENQPKMAPEQNSSQENDQPNQSVDTGPAPFLSDYMESHQQDQTPNADLEKPAMTPEQTSAWLDQLSAQAQQEEDNKQQDTGTNSGTNDTNPTQDTSQPATAPDPPPPDPKGDGGMPNPDDYGGGGEGPRRVGRSNIGSGWGRYGEFGGAGELSAAHPNPPMPDSLARHFRGPDPAPENGAGDGGSSGERGARHFGDASSSSGTHSAFDDGGSSGGDGGARGGDGGSSGDDAGVRRGFGDGVPLPSPDQGPNTRSQVLGRRDPNFGRRSAQLASNDVYKPNPDDGGPGGPKGVGAMAPNPEGTNSRGRSGRVDLRRFATQSSKRSAYHGLDYKPNPEDTGGPVGPQARSGMQ